VSPHSRAVTLSLPRAAERSFPRYSASGPAVARHRDFECSAVPWRKCKCTFKRC
jgi:hypothetical protein